MYWFGEFIFYRKEVTRALRDSACCDESFLNTGGERRAHTGEAAPSLCALGLGVAVWIKAVSAKFPHSNAQAVRRRHRLCDEIIPSADLSSNETASLRLTRSEASSGELTLP